MKKTRNTAGVERGLEFNFRQVHFQMAIIYPSAVANQVVRHVGLELRGEVWPINLGVISLDVNCNE